MVGAAVFTYGLLMSFVLSVTSRNARERRPNPRAMQYAGYVLCGVTSGLSMALFAYAGALHLGYPIG